MLTPIKAIRVYCVECSGWVAREVRECQMADCPLFPYRLGKNPSRAGKGGNPSGLAKAYMARKAMSQPIDSEATGQI